MKNLMKKLVLIVLFAFISLAVVGCNNADVDGEITDEEAVIEFLSSISVKYADGETDVTVTKDIQLPTSSDEKFTITWKSNDENVISTTGKVTQADVNKTVKLTVVVKLNDVSLEKSFTVTVLAKEVEEPEPEITAISSILAMEIEEGASTEDTYVVKGEITEVQNTTYGNVVIKDASGSLLVYGIFDEDGNRYDALEYKPVVGDTITVTGCVKKYSGTNEISNATLIKVEKGSGESSDPDTPEDTSLSTAATVLALALEDGALTTEEYKLKGTITEVQNTIYGNVVIQDSTGSILLYGLYDSTGETRYDALEYKPVVGDTITVQGCVKNYQGTNELANAKILAVVKGGSDTPETSDDEVQSTIADVLALTVEDGAQTAKKYIVTGTVTSVKNATFGNLMISDGENEILVYGLYDADGNRYDALTYKPDEGDTITVCGYVTSYSGTNEFTNAILRSYTEGEIGGDDPIIEAEVIDTTIADIFKLEIAENASTTDEYRVTGKVTFVQSESHGDLYISDGTNSILVYGVIDEDGNAYSALENKPTAGDTITVSGIIKNYKGVYEIVEGLIESISEGEAEELKTITIAKAKTLNNGSLAKVEGTVIAVNTKEFLVQDSTGTILVYMNYKTFTYVVGDKLTIIGAITQYAGINQFDYNATITVDGKETYTDPEPTVLDKDTFEAKITTPVVGEFIQLTGKLVSEDGYYDMEIEGSTKKASILYPTADLNLGLYVDKQIKVNAYIIGISSEADRLNLMVVSCECLEVVTGDQLPQTYNFVCTASGETGLATGWSWTKMNSKGSYAAAYNFYQSFRNDGEGIQSPMLTASEKIKVTINYFLNNLGTSKNKACYIKVTAYTADGVVVDTETSDNLNTVADVVKSKLTGTHDLEFTLEGEDIAYITVEFIKDGGGNIGFGTIKIEDVE